MLEPNREPGVSWHALAVAVVLLLATLIRIKAVDTAGGISPDGPYYLHQARQLTEQPWPQVVRAYGYPPGQPGAPAAA